MTPEEVKAAIAQLDAASAQLRANLAVIDALLAELSPEKVAALVSAP